MYHLVSDISNFLIPLFRRIHYDMGAKQHEELPVKPECQIKRQTIQQAMHQQVVPIFSFRLRGELPATCLRRSVGFWSKTIFFPANVAQAIPGVPPVGFDI